MRLAWKCCRSLFYFSLFSWSRYSFHRSRQIWNLCLYMFHPFEGSIRTLKLYMLLASLQSLWICFLYMCYMYDVLLFNPLPNKTWWLSEICCLIDEFVYTTWACTYPVHTALGWTSQLNIKCILVTCKSNWTLIYLHIDLNSIGESKGL